MHDWLSTAFRPIPPEGRWTVDRLDRSQRNYRWHDGTNWTWWYSDGERVLKDESEFTKKNMRCPLRSPTTPPPAPQGDPVGSFGRRIEAGMGRPLDGPEGMGCVGLDWHYGQPPCTRPVDMVVEIHSSYGDDLIATCAGHVFHANHRAKGIIGVAAIAIDGAWQICSYGHYTNYWCRHDVAAGRTLIDPAVMNAELVVRLRAQMSDVLAAGPCEHDGGGRRGPLYSCDVALRLWASSGSDELPF